MVRVMAAAGDDGMIGQAITAALADGRQEDWDALWHAVDALAGETTFASWSGGHSVGSEDRSVMMQMPFPGYVASVNAIGDRLGALGLIVGFDWPNWDGMRRYQADPDALDAAPVGDAVRLLTGIQRGERFCDGNIEGALTSGVMQAALGRLRRWYDEQSRA